MDVPFRSSGALSRQHYGLVRRVEEEISLQAADKLVVNEVEVVKRQMSEPGLQLVRDLCKFVSTQLTIVHRINAKNC